MTDIYDYYLYDFSKIYLREGQLAPKGVAIHKGPQDGRFYYSDGRSRDHTHNAQYISNRDIEVLEMVRSGTLNLENIGAYAILMLEKLGLVTEDEDGETILTDEGEQIKSPGIAILSRVDREEALLKNPLKSRKMVVDDQLLKELDGIKNYDPSNPHTIDRIRLFGEKIELYEGLGLINPIRGSARGLTNIGEKILNSNIGDVVSIPLPQDVSIRVPDDNHNATNNLNPLEESTVEWYKHRGYESINKALLSGDVSDTRTNNAICCLDNVLERHKIVNPQTVYSGVGSRVGNMLLSMDKGDTFQIDTYLSTSLRRATALTFSNSIPVDGNYRKVVLKINTPMNATGYYYGDTEEYDDEDEILFPRATQYILKSKEEKGEAIIITCDRIDKSTKATQVDNSRVYLQYGDKPPKGVIIHKGSRDPNARWYESNTRNKASGINRNELYLSDEDIAILNKFKEFNPTLNDASKKREMDRMVFGRRSDEPSLDDYLIRLKQKGPDMGAGEEVERMRKMSILGLITTTLYGWGFGYQLSDKELLLDESGIYTFKANKREEILSANPIMQIPPQKDIFIDINKESHLKNGAFTEDEIDVINNYKLHDYHDINIGLITCDVSKKTNSDLPVADCICHLDNILSRCRLSGPAVVYNGASKKIGEMFYNGELAEGDIIQTDAFLSTSLKSEVAQGFCAAIDVGGVEHTVMLEISMPAESTGFYFGDDDVAYNDKINKSTKEYEILLPRACQFKITGVNITDGDHGKIIQVKCDRLSKDSAISHREIQADNSRVYLNPGEKAPQGATIYAGTRKRTARYYKTEEVRSKETYGRNVGHIYVAPEDLEALNKIQFFDPSLEEIKQKYFKDFPDTPDEIVMDFKDDYLERGPDLTDDEFDRLNRMTNVGLTYWDGRKYCVTADGVEIRKPGVNLIKRYRREELIAQNAKTYGFISDKPDYPVDITRGEDHSQMPMSEGERSALTGYKGSLYKEINPALLGSGNLKMNLHRIANLDALLSRSVISSPTVTYNGTSSRIGEMLMSMVPGDMFQIDTYLSTSLSSGTAAGFSSDFYGSLGKKTSQVLLEISLPAGAHGFYFGENDNVDHPEGDQFGGPEREILLPRASQFRIDAIEKEEAGSDTYRDRHTVKVTLIVPPNLKEVIQADNSKVYLKDGEKPPKGARVYNGPEGGKYYESNEIMFTYISNNALKLLGRIKEWGKSKGTSFGDPEYDHLITSGLVCVDGGEMYLSDDGHNAVNDGLNVVVLSRLKREEYFRSLYKKIGLVDDNTIHSVRSDSKEGHSKIHGAESSIYYKTHGHSKQISNYLVGFNNTFDPLKCIRKGQNNCEVGYAHLPTYYDEEVPEQICKLDNLISKCIISDPITLYRGCPTQVADQILSGNYGVGDILQLDTFASTTTDEGLIDTFIRPAQYQGEPILVELVIDQPSGSTCFYYGDDDNEKEVLLPRGTQLRIKSIQEKRRENKSYWKKCIVISCDRISSLPRLNDLKVDNSKVYLQPGEKPPKGARLHKGTRKPTARWYKSEEVPVQYTMNVKEIWDDFGTGKSIDPDMTKLLYISGVSRRPSQSFREAMHTLKKFISKHPLLNDSKKWGFDDDIYYEIEDALNDGSWKSNRIIKELIANAPYSPPELTDDEKFLDRISTGAKGLGGDYLREGSYTKESLSTLLRKIKSPSQIFGYMLDANRGWYSNDSDYSLSHTEADTLTLILNGMFEPISTDYAVSNFSLSYNDLNKFATDNIKEGEIFKSNSYPVFSDNESAIISNAYEVKDDDTGVETKVIFTTAFEGVNGIKYGDNILLTNTQSWKVESISESVGEDGIKVKNISILPVSEEEYLKNTPYPQSISAEYIESVRSRAEENGNGLDALVAKCGFNVSEEYEKGALFNKGKYSKGIYLDTESLKNLNRLLGIQSNFGYRLEEDLQKADMLKKVCEAAPPLPEGLTVFMPFDVCQIYDGHASTISENEQYNSRVKVIDGLESGSTFKIRQNMVGDLDPDNVIAHCAFSYVDTSIPYNRERTPKKIMYRYTSKGDPDLDKGVVTYNGGVVLPRTLNWRVVKKTSQKDGDRDLVIYDIEPIKSVDNPNYPQGEVDITSITPLEEDPGSQAGSNHYGWKTIDKYDEMDVEINEAAGSNHPLFDEETTLEAQAMKCWCRNDYIKIGEYLRTGKMPDEPTLMYPPLGTSNSNFTERFTPETIIPYLDKYIETFPAMPEGVMLYRGVGANTAARMIKNTKVGDICTDLCYMSFAEDPKVAWKFAKKSEKTCDDDPKVFFRLVSKGGEHAALGNWDESEFVFGRNTKLRITRISKADYDFLEADHGGYNGVYPTPVIVYDVEIVE